MAGQVAEQLRGFNAQFQQTRQMVGVGEVRWVPAGGGKVGDRAPWASQFPPHSQEVKAQRCQVTYRGPTG